MQDLTAQSKSNTLQAEAQETIFLIVKGLELTIVEKQSLEHIKLECKMEKLDQIVEYFSYRRNRLRFIL